MANAFALEPKRGSRWLKGRTCANDPLPTDLTASAVGNPYKAVSRGPHQETRKHRGPSPRRLGLTSSVRRFTHIHLFWVAGLLLALIDLPDFSGLFGRMAHALERIAGTAPRRGGGSSGEPPDPPDSREIPVDREPEHHGRRKEPTHA